MATFTLLLCVLFLQISAVQSGRSDIPKNTIQSKKNDVLAFSAELSADAVNVVAPGGNIVFDRTITNVGGLYFNTSGQFVCPDGLYVFVWSLMQDNATALPGMRCIGSLRDGGVDRKYGPKTSYLSPAFSGVTEMIYVHACSTNPPSAVTITSQPWTHDVSSNSVFYRGLTSFSGFKLQSGIAFTAELSEDQMAFPGLRIMFDEVLVNVGGYYDVINGRFRCPDDSVYVFSLSVHTRDPSTPWSVSRIMMDGEMVMQGPISYLATSSYDSGSSSTTVVLQCSADFSVYVEAQAAHDNPYNSYGAELTSFTGFKLYNITTETVAFTVLMTQDFTPSTNNMPLTFDEVITNIGGAFNAITSSFVCPDERHYLFTWTTVSTLGRVSTRLFRDGSNVKQLLTNPISGITMSGSSTQSVILQCQAGSVFQVVQIYCCRTLLGGYTSFSGYQLPG